MKTELEEAAENYANMHQDVSANLGKPLVKGVFEDGAKSNAAKDYWFKIFKEKFIVSPNGK